jgi:hypothetical protein
VLVAGCGGKGDNEGGTPATDAASAQTAAATLRADLIARLADQTFLTGAAVAEAVRGGPGQPQFAAALDAAKANAGALARTVAAAYGAGPQGTLEELWREQADGFAAYATAKLAAKEADVQQALTTLDRLRTTIAATLAQAIGGLDRTKLAEDLRLQTQALIVASDALIAKDPNAYAQLGAAAARTPALAERLAVAIATDKPARYVASPDGPAAAMRGGLTARLVADSYLTLLRASATIRFGSDADTTRIAAGAADANTVALSHLLSSVYGEDAGQRMLRLWREQAALVGGYSKAKAREDDIAAPSAAWRCGAATSPAC